MRRMNVLTMLLAGGIGTRLSPLTSNRCKPAVPFGGNFRIIDFTLMNCLLSDLRQIHLLGQYHVQSLHSHQMNRWNFLSREFGEFIEMVPPKLRAAARCYKGTADAIFSNLDLLDRDRPDVVLVLSGDHVYRADYQKFIAAHDRRDADVTILTGKVGVKEASSFGVVSFDGEGRVQEFVEKPADASPFAIDGECQVNLGVYCFKTEFLVKQLVADSRQDTDHDFGKNILPTSLDVGRVLSCPHDVIAPGGNAYWRDVGTIDSYFETSMDLLRSPTSFGLTDPRWQEGSRFHEWLPARYAVTARVGGRPVEGRNLISSGVEMERAQVVNCIVSPGCRVGRDAELDSCILFPGAQVGEGCLLRNVIVEEGVSVPRGAAIGFGGDARRFTTSPRGVVVISARPAFSDAEGDIPTAPEPAISRLSHITDRLMRKTESAVTVTTSGS